MMGINGVRISKVKLAVMNYLNATIKVLEKSKYQKIFVILLIVLGPVFAVTSDILVPLTLELNPLADPLKIFLIGVIVILIALNLTLLVNSYDLRKSLVKKTSIFGMITALFTTTCPICQPIWLVWLGFGSITSFLANISIYLALLSIASLFFSLHNLLNSESSPMCKITKKNIQEIR